MARSPVSQTPFLDNLSGLVELDVFAGDIAVEDGEFSANVGTLELARSTACEQGNALGVGESLVELFGGGAHLVGGCHGGSADGALVGSRLGRCRFDLVLFLDGLRVDGRGGEATRRVFTRGVLEVLGMFGDQGVPELAESSGQLWSDFRPDKVLNGLFGGLIGVVCDLVLNSAISR